jgi:selenocysteine lyase/cysteine desulfurase
MSRTTSTHPGLNRRQFARLLALGGSAALVPAPTLAWRGIPKLGPPPEVMTEGYWAEVRSQFVLAPELAIMNAANLCPSSAPVLESVYANTRDMDRDPSFNNRAKLTEGKEVTRRLLAEFLRVTPDEIIITRNTSEANNLVSSGIDLKAGDEVVISSDNHPSNHEAWREKARRLGFTVQIVQQANPYPGDEYYLEAFGRAITPRTKVLAFTHQTSTVGDPMPAKALCALARQRGVLSLVDGAQTFGVFDVDLSDMQPDFFSGSAHKWPCGPKEVGVLYVNKASQPRIWPTILSAYTGAAGLSKTFEGFGQRDEPAIIAFGEALKFQTKIGRQTIEARARELTQALIKGLQKINGMKLWTHPAPERSATVVSFQPGSLDVRKLSEALYSNEHIACATRGGQDRPGLRFSPHFYNSHAEVERVLAALAKYSARGV